MRIDQKKLDEWRQDYHDGYEKAYKCIPDLIDEVEKLQAVVTAVRAAEAEFVALGVYPTTSILVLRVTEALKALE